MGRDECVISKDAKASGPDLAKSGALLLVKREPRGKRQKGKPNLAMAWLREYKGSRNLMKLMNMLISRCCPLGKLTFPQIKRFIL